MYGEQYLDTLYNYAKYYINIKYLLNVYYNGCSYI